MTADSKDARLTKLKRAAQNAAAKANVLERFVEATAVFESFGERLSVASRRAIAACGMGALGVGVGLALVSFPQSLALAPLLGIGFGSLGAIATRPALAEARDAELEKTAKRLEYAKQQQLPQAAQALERHYADLAVADAAKLASMLERAPRLLLSGTTPESAASDGAPQL